MTERRVRIVKPWRRSNGQVMCFDTLCGYVRKAVARQDGSEILYLHIPIWPNDAPYLAVPAACVVDAPLGSLSQTA